MTTSLIHLKALIKSRLRQAGFGPVIITRPQLPPGFAGTYTTWLNTNLPGQLEYLARHKPVKLDPAQGKYQTLIIVGASYIKPIIKFDDFRVALYAQSRDYHNILGKRLRRLVKQLRQQFPQTSWLSGLDASPLAERALAVQAGLGFVGLNYLVIHPRLGSFMFIGTILTSLKLPVDKIKPYPLKVNCQNCRACQAVCPTQALDGSTFTANRCLSYLTIEHKGPVPIPLRPKLGDWLLGCDLCQLTCPHNFHPQQTTPINEFYDTAYLTGLTLRRLLLIDSPFLFDQLFAGTPFKRPGWESVIRNACYIAGNQKRVDLIPLLTRWVRHGTPTTQDAASWALHQINQA